VGAHGPRVYSRVHEITRGRIAVAIPIGVTLGVTGMSSSSGAVDPGDRSQLFLPAGREIVTDHQAENRARCSLRIDDRCGNRPSSPTS
jgi:hypothetical protein